MIWRSLVVTVALKYNGKGYEQICSAVFDSSAIQFPISVYFYEDVVFCRIFLTKHRTIERIIAIPGHSCISKKREDLKKETTIVNTRQYFKDVYKERNCKDFGKKL